MYSIAYKVVRNSYSANHKIKVRYKKNVWIKAPNIGKEKTKLFVFNTIKNAIDFAEKMYNYTKMKHSVFVCIVKNAKKYKVNLKGVYTVSYKHFWNRYNNKLDTSICFPEGTLLVDEVMLLERVDF